MTQVVETTVEVARLEPIDAEVPKLTKAEVEVSAARAYTPEEVKENFLQEARDRTQYWLDLYKGENITHAKYREGVEGAVFGVLSIIDGKAEPLPAFKLIPNPSEELVDQAIEKGQNWYATPEDAVQAEQYDISGELRFLFHKVNN